MLTINKSNQFARDLSIKSLGLNKYVRVTIVFDRIYVSYDVEEKTFPRGQTEVYTNSSCGLGKEINLKIARSSNVSGFCC